MGRNDKKGQIKNLGGSWIRIPRGKGGEEERRSEGRGEDSGIEGRDTRQSSTATECEAAATKAAFDARQRSKRRERRREGRKGARQGQEQWSRQRATRGKNGAWVQNAHIKGGKSSSQANEANEPSQYTSYTLREQQWGVLKKEEA